MHTDLKAPPDIRRGTAGPIWPDNQDVLAGRNVEPGGVLFWRFHLEPLEKFTFGCNQGESATHPAT